MKKFLQEHSGVLFVLLLAVGAAIAGHLFYPLANPFWQNIFSGLSTSLWDVFLVVIVLGIFEKRREKHSRIRELKGRIDCFKRQNDEYAKSIIGASLRELEVLGAGPSYDFRGLLLSNVSFSHDFEIEDISGSVFSDGLYFKNMRNNGATLKDVSFIGMNCSSVVFGKGNLCSAHFIDCCFLGSNLSAAVFSGAIFKWDLANIELDTANWFDYEGDNPDGSPLQIQKYYPPFWQANLTRAIFDGCSFLNADFRGAENIAQASFKGVMGLETCLFDPEVKEELMRQGIIP